MAKTSFSGEMVRNTKKVVLTVLGTPLAEIVMKCGSYTGKKNDKVAEFIIKLTEIENSSIKIPAHSCVVIQATMKEYHEVGDHCLYICDVEQVYGDEAEAALFSWNGYSEIAPAHQ